MKKTLTDRCPVATRFHIESYWGHGTDCDRRVAAGESQRRCKTCERYRWPDHAAACREFVAEEGEADA